MSFSIALSGLNAANSELNVTSNNIANVGTFGFKGSRAEFADVYSVNPFGSSKTAIGSGVMLTQVRQNFNQGSLERTENGLDLAVNGQGFFVTSQKPDTLDAAYTRAGAFGVNDKGYVVNSQGAYLQVFPVDADTGKTTSTSLTSAISLKVPDSFGAPRPTTKIDIGVNLPANAAPIPTTTPFDKTNTSTYTSTTSTTVYDSLGDPHTLQTYFIKRPPDAAAVPPVAPNTWETQTFLDGNPMTPAGPSNIVFDAGGVLIEPAGGAAPPTGAVAFNPMPLSNGANPLNLSVDFAPAPDGNNSTQFSSAFLVSTLQQDGAGTGRLNGLEVTDDGQVKASYTNGESKILGKLVMADFPNAQGLRQVGNTMWRETTESGQVLAGEAGTGRFGSIQSGALETANVELTNQLVKLITAQRNFQASAKAIETANTVTQTIINI